MNNGKRKNLALLKRINQNKLFFVCFYFVKCLLKIHYCTKIKLF